MPTRPGMRVRSDGTGWLPCLRQMHLSHPLVAAQIAARIHGGQRTAMLPLAPPDEERGWLIDYHILGPDRAGRCGSNPNGLAFRNLEVLEAVEFDPAGDVGHAGLVVAAPGEVAGFLRLAGAGPSGAVADGELRAEDLEQEGGQGQGGL